jgi:hypothetical protein
MPETVGTAAFNAIDYLTSMSATAVGATAATAAAASSIYSTSQANKRPSMPGAPPPLLTPDGTQAAAASMQRARGAAGIGATNVTGPQGLTDPASLAPKSLLGG